VKELIHTCVRFMSLSRGIRLSRQTTLIIAILAIHFILFGYICNVISMPKPSSSTAAGTEVLYLDQILFNLATLPSLFILIGIIFFVAIREQFFEYALRNAFWLVPFIIIESWIWYWINGGFDLTAIGAFFLSGDGYLTIAGLILVNMGTAIFGASVRIKYQNYSREKEDSKKSQVFVSQTRNEGGITPEPI